MNSPDISIIIPTFQAADRLARCLQSIKKQGHRSWEVWMIDGASTDQTVSIFKDFSKEDDRFQWVSEADQGIYDAMNKGWKKAKGEWVYFMGADDQFYDEYVLSRLSSEFQKSDIDVLYGNVILPCGELRGGKFDAKRLVKGPICHQAMFFRNELKSRVPLYDKNYKVRADYDLTVRLFFKKDIKFKYVAVEIAHFNDTGYHSFTHDLAFEKDIYAKFFQHFYPALSKEEILEGIKPSIFFHLKRGEFCKGLYLFFQMKKNAQNIRDFLYCLKVRVGLVK